MRFLAIAIVLVMAAAILMSLGACAKKGAGTAEEQQLMERLRVKPGTPEGPGEAAKGLTGAPAPSTPATPAAPGTPAGPGATAPTPGVTPTPAAPAAPNVKPGGAGTARPMAPAPGKGPG